MNPNHFARTELGRRVLIECSWGHRLRASYKLETRR